MTNRLNYNNGTNVVPDGSVRISASSIGDYFEQTPTWYRTHILELEKFIGSTASVLGTCVHFYSEDSFLHGTVDKNEIFNYINMQSSIVPELDVDTILHQHPIMGQTLLNYLEENPSYKVEEFLYKELYPGIGVGGSCDSLVKLDDGTYLVRDWKTSSNKVTALTKDLTD